MEPQPILPANWQEYFPLPKIRPKQAKALDFIYRMINQGVKDIIISAPTGCHGAGQRLLRHDGTHVRVEDVCLDDALLGPDGLPRYVTKLFRGTAPLYKVTPLNGQPFSATIDHCLSLRRTNDGTSLAGTTLDIPIRAYLRKSGTFKHIHKLFRPDRVEFVNPKNRPIPPYVLGLWLADGSVGKPEITDNEPETLAAWSKFGQSLGLGATDYTKNGCISRRLTNGRNGGAENPVTFLLRLLGVFDKKKIPEQYLTAPITERLELLAGLFDTDSEFGHNCYGFSSTLPELASSVAFIARSVGLAATVAPRQTKCQTGASCSSWRVTISGHTNLIPCRTPKKAAHERRQTKNVLNTGFSLSNIGIGEYFGFQLTGDHRYLLSDFTVTHNSGKSAIGATIAFWCGQMTMPLAGERGAYYLCTQKLLQDQLETDIERYPPLLQSAASLKTSSEYECPNYSDCGTGMLHKPACSCLGQQTCTYRRQVKKFTSSSLAITNYPYFFTERIYVKQFPPRRILIADECHTLENQLLKFVELVIGPEEIVQFLPTAKGVPPLKELADFYDWLVDTFLPGLNVYREAFDTEASMTPQRAKELAALDNMLAKVERAIDSIASDQDNWVFWQETTEKLPGMQEHIAIAKPLSVAPFFKDFLQGTADVRIYMSAFPGTKEVFCASLGLNPDKTAMLSLGSVFPKENRPIHAALFGSMSKKNQADTMPRFLKLLGKMIDSHGKEKGIIHCNSYALGQAISDHFLKTPQGRRLLFPRKADEREDVYKKHRESKEPTVILSPSFTEGFDFNDDAARWQVIAKVPFPYLGDRQVATKKERNPEWYALRTVSSIVQASGRIVRSENDYGITYITDSDFEFLWERYSYLFPNWWKEALHWH